ncbi:unnamed protein product [Ilex paraguariensis]|uniref:Tyrosine-protein kinase catalytic domain-containing protein n=1 Tax=Ilex paraguariensis TaxID=185542 RepID=A0ABC8UVC1_9AQUA
MGILKSGSRNLVAVKKLNKLSSEGEREFKSEVDAIGKTHHKNLAQLLGYCHEGPHRLLVYEFMSNGSLATFLFGSPRPNWTERRGVEMEFGEEERAILTDWVCTCYMEGRLDCLTENEDLGLCDISVLQRWLMTAIWCIQEDPSKRPIMKTVIQMLEGYVAVPLPPFASSSFSLAC